MTHQPDLTTAQLEMSHKILRQEWNRIKHDPSLRFNLVSPQGHQCILSSAGLCERAMDQVGVLILLLSFPIATLRNVADQGLLGVQNGHLLFTSLRKTGMVGA